MAYVRIAKLRDALELAPILRKADLAELAASTTASPLQCLVEPFTDDKAQNYSMVGDDEEIVGMFGVRPAPEISNGIVWMLTSEKVYAKHVAQFVRECRPYTAILNAQYNRIYNYVDARNKKAIRWLKFVGFTIDKTPYPVGPDNTPFLFLYRLRG